jgi:hypothetical protein
LSLAQVSQRSPLVRVLILLALLGISSPLQAQVSASRQVDRRPFAEGGFLAGGLDVSSPATDFGGSGEFAMYVWQGRLQNEVAAASLRGRVETQGRDVFVSVLFALEFPLTRRVTFEMPLGFAASVGSSEPTKGFRGDMGVPIALSNRVAIVPRAGGFLLAGREGIGMLSTVALGLRCRF